MVIAGVFAVIGDTGSGAVTPTTRTIFAIAAKPAVSAAGDSRSVEVGVRFSPKVNLWATGVRFYKGSGNTGTHTGTLWSASGQPLRRVFFRNETASGWQVAKFTYPMPLKANVQYVISYHAPHGHYAYTYNYFIKSVSNTLFNMPAAGTNGKPNGMFRYGTVAFPTTGSGHATNYWVDATMTTTRPGSTTTTKPTATTKPTVTTKPPTTTTKPPVVGAFPSIANTGVPTGTNLTAYTGPMDIRTCGVVIDSKIVTGNLTILAGNGTRSASTPCVTIRKSLIKGSIDDKWADFVCGARIGCGPVVISDTEVAFPRAADVAAVSDSNIYMWRTYVHGARSGVQCDGFCEIHDSYLVADHEYQDAHMDAFISNGNSGHKMVLDHNSFLCAPVNGPVPDGAGCAADVGLFGDFSPISNMVVTNNLFKATSHAGYCAYTGAGLSGKPFPIGTHLVWRGNVWQRGANLKCGFGGAVRDWKAYTGNSWCNNLWDDKTAVLPGVTCNA
jgi:hypothetical protein